MNRKMFSLVTSLAILSSSFSPTWAAGKNFTYNNLEKSLAIHAEAKEVKSSEAKEELPLVRETMPDDSVKDKYARIIFVPGTSTINGVKNYGKLLDKEGEKVLLSDISYKDKTGKEFVVRGKEYYALKTAKWINILEYKENNKKVLYVRKADNNESDPEKKKYHGFLGWKQDGKDVNPFDYGFPANISKCSIDNPLVFKSKFQNVPYFYSNKSSPKLDYDGYDFSLKKKDYSRVEFYPVGQESTWAGVLSLKDTQKKFSLTDIQNSKNIYLYISKKSGPYKFGDFKPEPISSDNKKFWYWSSNGDFSKSVKDDFEIGSKDLEFRAQYIGEYLKIDDNFDLVENPIPEGFYEVNFKPEDGYSSISNFQNAYRKFAVREGCGVGNITNLPKHPELIDMNNHKYTEKTAWYDGYTKIDDISTVKIDSDKVFTARIVRNFESEKFSPVVKEVEVNLNEDVSLEKLRKGITNLPEEVKVEIKTKADTSQLGKSKVVLKLIFSDTSSKEVEVPIKVIEREDGKLITPIPTIGAENIIKEKVSYNGKINLLDNIKNLPSEAKVEDVSDPINTKTPGKYIGKVKVTFKEGSSRIVEIPVEVLAPLSDSYNPSTKEVEVNLNEDVSPEKLKEGITNLPDNVEVEIKTRADTSKVVKTKAVLKLIFSDSSSKEVEVPVKIIDKISGNIITPIPTIKAEDIIKEEVPYNGKINLSENIKNLPEGAKIEDIREAIDTKTPGSYVGKVKVTFKDGSSRIVEIPVEVLAPLAEKFPAQIPEKTPVEKLESLIASEKSEIVEKVKMANPQADKVEVSDKGEVTLIYSDESKNVISSEDTIVLKEKEIDKKDPEDKPGKEEDNKDPEDKPGKEEDKKDPEDNPEKEENKDPEEKPGKEDKRDHENKPGKEEKNKPDKEEDKRDPEENIEEAKDKKENNLDSWNYFPRYYVRDHKAPTYKVEVKTNSQVSHTKTQVNPRKFVIDINSGTYTLTEDGKTLEKSMEVKPIIENNRTMLPLRALAEILDAKVIWNDATRTASFTRDGLTALIQIDGNKIVLSNGKTIDLEAKPLNVNGRIYLPLVYVGQVFGLTSGNADDDKENDIEWKEESKTVTINIK